MEEEDLKEKKFYKQKNFWLGAGAALVLFLVFSLGGRIFESSSFSNAFSKTLKDVFGSTSEKPIYEVDLATGKGRNFLENESLGSLSGKKDGEKSEKSLASVQNLVKPITKPKTNTLTSGEEKKKPVLVVVEKKESSNSEIAKEEKPKEVSVKECDFSLATNFDRRISFNELAWMGGVNSASDEWIEIKNNSGAEINLQGWQIKNQSEKIKIIFEMGEKILANSLMLLERMDDNSVPNVVADKIYKGAMSNESEWLKLFDAGCDLVDEVNASWGWGNFGGENAAKKTLERNLNDFAWHTSVSSGGTPRAINSIPVLVNGGEPEEGSGGSGSNSSSTQTNPPAPQNPAAMKILVSEVMVGSSASSDDEFIEIYNYGTEAADLTGWSIKKKTSSGAESSLVSASRLNGKVVPTGKYLLITHEGGYAGAVAGDVTWPASYALAYTNNSITIYNASGVVVDQVVWTDIPKDKSYGRSSPDVGAGFGVMDTPSPKNSQ